MTLGILGGLGPESTTTFIERIQTATDASCDQEHVPILADIDPSYADRLDAIREDDPVVAEQLVTNARDLAEVGATRLVIASNTTQYYRDAVVDAVDVPVYDWIGCTLDACDERGFDDPAVMATSTVSELGLYDRNSDLRYVELDEAIYAFKSGNRKKAIALFQSAFRTNEGPFVVACTELSVLDTPRRMPVVDAVDAVAAEIISDFGQ